MNKNYLEILDSAASLRIPGNLDLFPRVAERINQRKAFIQNLRARPALAIMLAILALLLLTGVAYAIGRLAGYIPGVGIVDQGEPLRVLAEPVTVTRDGITLTVEQVVLSADKTVVVYKVEGIPADAYASDENAASISSYSVSSSVNLEGTPDVSYTNTANNNICFGDDRLLLPDGTLIPLQTGEGNGWTSGFEMNHVFGPIPMGINETTFLLSCIPATIPGRLPENWEIPLRFVPAPLDMNILPVVKITTPAVGESQPAMTLEQVIETDDGYILIGKFRSIGLPVHAIASNERGSIKITNATGQMVDATHASNIEPSDVFGEFVWGYEIKGKKHVWPLTLTIDAVHVVFYQQITEFEFDTGLNSQEGQKWILNKDIQFEGYAIRVVSIERTSNGYLFVFKTDPDVIGITADIKDFPSSSGYGGGDGFGKGELYSGMEYKEEPPSGKLTIELSWLDAIIHGPWQVQWSPENVLPTP